MDDDRGSDEQPIQMQLSIPNKGRLCTKSLKQRSDAHLCAAMRRTGSACSLSATHMKEWRTFLYQAVPAQGIWKELAGGNSAKRCNNTAMLTEVCGNSASSLATPKGTQALCKDCTVHHVHKIMGPTAHKLCSCGHWKSVVTGMRSRMLKLNHSLTPPRLRPPRLRPSEMRSSRLDPLMPFCDDVADAASMSGMSVNTVSKSMASTISAEEIDGEDLGCGVALVSLVETGSCAASPVSVAASAGFTGAAAS